MPIIGSFRPGFLLNGNAKYELQYYLFTGFRQDQQSYEIMLPGIPKPSIFSLVFLSSCK